MGGDRFPDDSIIQLANEYGRKDQTRIKVLLAALMGSSTVQTSMK